MYDIYIHTIYINMYIVFICHMHKLSSLFRIMHFWEISIPGSFFVLLVIRKSIYFRFIHMLLESTGWPFGNSFYFVFLPVVVYIKKEYIFYLHRCTLLDFPSVFSQTSLPFLSCYRTTKTSFPFHLLPSPVYPTGLSFYIFPNCLVIRFSTMTFLSLMSIFWVITNFCLHTETVLESFLYICSCAISIKFAVFIS